MFLCYIDESGTSDTPGNTSHFIFAGFSIPIYHWKNCDQELHTIKLRYNLADAEIHTAWILRKYLEQSRVVDFEKLYNAERRSAVERLRRAELLRLQASPTKNQYRQTKKNYAKTNAYIHLTLDQRKALILEIAQCVSNWGFARLFAECIDKIQFDPRRAPQPADEQAFEQVVSRFEQYLQSISPKINTPYFGLLIHDNNETVSHKHTNLMKRFHHVGTLWTNISHIIETPLFVDSQLTGMVQIADLCAYGLRRYLENKEIEIFRHIFNRADRKNNLTVGVRHYTKADCTCEICATHSA